MRPKARQHLISSGRAPRRVAWILTGLSCLVFMHCNEASGTPEEIALPRLRLKQVWATLSELSAPILETANDPSAWDEVEEVPQVPLNNLWESVQTVEAPDDAQALESAYLGVACLRRIQRNLRELKASAFPKAKEKLVSALVTDRATLADAIGALEGHLHIGVERAKRKRKRSPNKANTPPESGEGP